MIRQTASQREYFARRTIALHGQCDGSLTPASYNTVFSLLPLYATLLQSGELTQTFGAMRCAVNRRMTSVTQLSALNRENRTTRIAIARLIDEITKSREGDAELAELGLLLVAMKCATGIPEIRTTPFDGVRLSFPLFLTACMCEAYQNRCESRGQVPLVAVCE